MDDQAEDAFWMLPAHKMGEPIVLEQARLDLEGLIARLEEEVYDIRGETTRFERALRSQEEQVSQETKNVARLRGAPSNNPASLAFRRLGAGVYHSHHDKDPRYDYRVMDQWDRAAQTGLSMDANRGILSYVSWPDGNMWRLGPAEGEITELIVFPYPHFEPEY